MTRVLPVHWRALLAGAVLLLVASTVSAVTGTAARGAPAVSGAPTVPGPNICGSSVLISPWNYNGAPGTFNTSGTPGLPTFGAPGTDFPAQTSVYVVAAGDNTAAAGGFQYRAEQHRPVL